MNTKSIGTCCVILLVAILSATLSTADRTTAQKKPAKATTDTGMVKDLRLIRKTISESKKGPRYSSPQAKKAAQRIFGRVKFKGMTKKDVLWMLGDPATLSDFGRAPKPGKDASLVYCFFNDGGGHCYSLKFKNGRVTEVRGKPKPERQ